MKETMKETIVHQKTKALIDEHGLEAVLGSVAELYVGHDMWVNEVQQYLIKASRIQKEFTDEKVFGRF